MTVLLIKIVQVILALGILIVIHEFGHFFFAKIFGIRVDKFFLFFDAADVKLFSTKSGWFAKIFPKAKDWETEYGIGWVPFGGYCKIAGMIDESMDTEHLKTEPKSWEFRSKPAWQRILVMAGGVAANSHLRRHIAEVCEKNHVRFVVPSLKLCGDNAAMTGAQGYHMLRYGLTADSSLNAFASDEGAEEYLDSLKKKVLGHE